MRPERLVFVALVLKWRCAREAIRFVPVSHLRLVFIVARVTQAVEFAGQCLSDIVALGCMGVAENSLPERLVLSEKDSVSPSFHHFPFAAWAA